MCEEVRLAEIQENASFKLNSFPAYNADMGTDRLKPKKILPLQFTAVSCGEVVAGLHWVAARP